MAGKPSIASFFDILTPARTSSATLESIWKASYGEDYASNARPNAFYAQQVLDSIESAIRANVAQGVLLDVGCGHGLTGIDLASKLDLPLHGIDVSSRSIEIARENASLTGLTADFAVADAEHSGLPDSSCAAIICMDVVLFFPNKAAAFKEFARVLSPGGLLAFTTWEQTGYNARLGAAQIEDHKPLLQGADLQVLEYEEVVGAQEQQLRVFDALLSKEAQLRDELGEEAASMLVGMARSSKAESAHRRYILGVAKKPRT